jgi:apolipoprotein D and lipocalin family protein
MRQLARLLALTAVCIPPSAWGGAHDAPEPVRPIEISRFYSGRWYEIERTPMRITRNCVAGTTDYSRLPDGRTLDTDACRMGTPHGRLKTFIGPVTLLNPGQNTKMRVSYLVWHLFHIRRVYWILDHDDGYHWFILSDPSFEYVSLFSRGPQPPAVDVSRMRDELRQWGDDTSKLEKPSQFASPQDAGRDASRTGAGGVVSASTGSDDIP